MEAQSSIEHRLKLPEKYRYERVLGHPRLGAGERLVIADLEGPGCIRHLYHASSGTDRNFILRIYWDGEESPSVEVPVNDFFGVHHDVRYPLYYELIHGSNPASALSAPSYYPINSYYLSVKDQGGMGCYFPMPFGRSARVEIEARSEGTFTYTLDWHRYLTDEFDENLRFHSSWRRENPAPGWGDDFFVMDAVGRGYLVGFSLGVRLRTDDQRWSHAGSENLYIDGEATGEDHVVPHYLRAAGGENTFDVGYGGVIHRPDTYMYTGMPYYVHRDAGPALARHVLSAYRFYVHDLLPFESSLHFRWGSQANDMCMTAYWYQTEPHRPFVRMASWQDLAYGGWGDDEVEVKRGRYDLLKQIGADGAGAVLASPDDGTWWLYDGKEVLRKGAEVLQSGIERYSFHGFIDFSHVFNVRSTASNRTWPANASAVTTLEVERDTPATLHLSWGQRMTIRVNDGGLHDLGDHPTYRYRAIGVDLRRGKNVLMVNLDNPDQGLTWGAWTFSCRAVLPDGHVVVPRAATT